MKKPESIARKPKIKKTVQCVTATSMHRQGGGEENFNAPTQSCLAPNSVFPRLKNGVYVSSLLESKKLSTTESVESSVTVATSFHAIEIHHHKAREIINEFTGLLTSEEIALKLQIALTIIQKVIKELSDVNFIDTERNTIKLNNRFQSTIASRAAHTEDQSNDAAFSQLQKRLAPELSQATWLQGVRDGGVDVMTARQNFGVEIIGNSRTATLLYSILLASGVTNTRISLSASYKHPTVVASDLGSGSLRTSDLGLNFKSRLEELSREWSLFPVASNYALAQRGAPKPVMPEKNLRIICGVFDSQYVDHLLKDGHEHFFVGRAPGHAATIGPFVKPGKSPCMHCLALIEASRVRGTSLTAPMGTSDEFPVAIAHQVAALAAQVALAFIDTGTSEFLATQLIIDFLDAFSPSVRKFPRHPDCDCLYPKEEVLL
jgi:DNA-binding transcriptional regulator YhcF (GntR family)